MKMRRIDKDTMSPHCFVCKRQVKEEGIRFDEDGVSVVLHEGCLRLLGKVTQKAFQSMEVTKPPVRPSSLSEFLHEKQPKTQPEILACVAYFLEQKEGEITGCR